MLEPNTSFILCCTVFLISSLAGVRYFLGSNAPGSSANTFLICAVIASLKSVSTFIFDTPFKLASCSISSGTPFAPGISAPYLLHISTNSGITVDAPCNTIGVFGINSLIFFRISNLNFASPLNLYAPWLVPIAIASEKAVQASDSPENPEAKYICGTIYLSGEGVKKDPEKALLLIREAAKQGYRPARLALKFKYPRQTIMSAT